MKVVIAIGVQGWCLLSHEEETKENSSLLEAILEDISLNNAPDWLNLEPGIYEMNVTWDAADVEYNNPVKKKIVNES